MQQRNHSTQTWSSHDLHPKPPPPTSPSSPSKGKGGDEVKKEEEATLNFIFVMDLLNFSFWSEKAEEDEDKRFSVEYRGKSWTGYWSLVACLQRALDEGIPITDSHFWQDREELTMSRMEHIFRSSTAEAMPMLEERLDCLIEAGQVLYEKYDCSFANCVASADGSAVSLVKILARDFPCFCDEHAFEGETVRIYKRAQILVADVWACFDGRGCAAFADISAITMFADYRIPQMLTSLGVLLYSPSLEARIRRREELRSGENCEIEIRGCSIWAVEMIRRDIVESQPDQGDKINAILIDTFLYDTLKEQEAKGELCGAMPHHLTRSIWY